MVKGSNKGPPKPKAVVIARPSREYEAAIKARDYAGSKEERDAIREAEMEERRRQRETGASVDLGNSAHEWEKAAGFAAVGRAPPKAPGSAKGGKGYSGKGSKGRCHEKENRSWYNYASTTQREAPSTWQPVTPRQQNAWVEDTHAGSDPWFQGQDPWADMTETTDSQHHPEQDRTLSNKNGSSEIGNDSSNSNWNNDASRTVYCDASRYQASTSKGHSRGGGIRSDLHQDEKARRAELRRLEAEERRRARGLNDNENNNVATQQHELKDHVQEAFQQTAKQDATNQDWRFGAIIDYMFFKYNKGEWEAAKQVLCHAVEEKMSLPEIDNDDMLTVFILDEAFACFKKLLFCVDFLRTGGPQSKTSPEQRLDLLSEAATRQMPLGKVGVISASDVDDAWMQFQRSNTQRNQQNGSGYYQ